MTIFLKHKPIVYYMDSGEDVNLADWLIAEGATSGDIKVVIIETAIIGGTVVGGYALNIGNVSQFDSIILDVYGEIQGKGGIPASSPDGDGLIYTTYPLTINVKSTGVLNAGGGAGGKGGTGSNGSVTTWSADNWAKDTGNDYYFRNPTRVRNDEAVIAWAGNITQLLGVGIISTWGDYRKGSLKLTGSTTWGGQDLWYARQKKTITTVYGGIGGAGGDGEGYNQVATLGLPGEVVSGAQDGGDGGDGGAFGVAGARGDLSGTYGGTQGYAIYAYEGAVTGVIVNNSGTINGRTYY